MAWLAAQGCDLAVQPPRVDYYLRLNGDDSLGIKLREGRIEVKRRTQPGEIVRFGERAAGLVESWRKWSFGLREFDERLTDSGDWLGVWKARRLCFLAVGDDGRFSPHPGNLILQQGCACELTEVRLIGANEMWWTVGFEAFGQTANRRERLILAARQLLSQDSAPALAAENSYSYPSWLQNT